MSSTLQRPDHFRPPAEEPQRVDAHAAQKLLPASLPVAGSGSPGRPDDAQPRHAVLWARLVWPLLLLGSAVWAAGIALVLVGWLGPGVMMVAAAFLLTILGLACAAASTRAAPTGR